MYNKKIILSPDAVNFPLSPLWQAKGAGGYYIVSGVPSAATSCTFVLAEPGGKRYGVAMEKLTALGVWGAWIEGYCILTDGQGKYEVICSVSSKTVWLGSGLFNVVPTEAVTDTPEPPSSGALVDYVLETGSDSAYHKQTVSQEPDTGIWVPEISAETYHKNADGSFSAD